VGEINRESVLVHGVKSTVSNSRVNLSEKKGVNPGAIIIISLMCE
jgi:hypothetical protein